MSLGEQYGYLNCFSSNMTRIGNLSGCCITFIWKWSCVVNGQSVNLDSLVSMYRSKSLVTAYHLLKFCYTLKIFHIEIFNHTVSSSTTSLNSLI